MAYFAYGVIFQMSCIQQGTPRGHRQGGQLAKRAHRRGRWGRQAGEGWWEGGQMGGHEVGGQKRVAGERRGKEGVNVMDEGAVSQMRVQCHG